MTRGVCTGRLPSADPEVERAADDVVHDPDAYFTRQRELCKREAQEYVEQELHALSMSRRRAGIRAFLARLSRARG
ncbi:MAG TPA: hypothetical protein VFO16_07040 [Pseudonocardiaceae bacterium]|nr:hypothetical protein [Pseudonocardiaceae bacterium]